MIPFRYTLKTSSPPHLIKRFPSLSHHQTHSRISPPTVTFLRARFSLSGTYCSPKNNMTHKTKVEQPLTQDPKETIFAKIANGEMESKPVYEDDRCIVINDINPAAPVHMLILSKKIAIGQVHHATEDQEAELGHMMIVAGKVAKQEKLTQGYRLVINQGVNALQTVNYLHIHMLAGKDNMAWPPC